MTNPPLKKPKNKKSSNQQTYKKFELFIAQKENFREHKGKETAVVKKWIKKRAKKLKKINLDNCEFEICFCLIYLFAVISTAFSLSLYKTQEEDDDGDGDGEDLGGSGDHRRTLARYSL